MDKLNQIMALADKVDGTLPKYILTLTITERNIIADALTVLYGVEKNTNNKDNLHKALDNHFSSKTK